MGWRAAEQQERCEEWIEEKGKKEKAHVGGQGVQRRIDVGRGVVKEAKEKWEQGRMFADIPFSTEEMKEGKRGLEKSGQRRGMSWWYGKRVGENTKKKKVTKRENKWRLGLTESYRAGNVCDVTELSLLPSKNNIGNTTGIGRLWSEKWEERRGRRNYSSPISMQAALIKHSHRKLGLRSNVSGQMPDRQPASKPWKLFGHADGHKDRKRLFFHLSIHLFIPSDQTYTERETETCNQGCMNLFLPIYLRMYLMPLFFTLFQSKITKNCLFSYRTAKL